MLAEWQVYFDAGDIRTVHACRLTKVAFAFCILGGKQMPAR